MGVEVQLRFDANRMKREVKERLNKKVGALKKDDSLYTDLLNEWYDNYIVPTLARYVDTGAFAYTNSGESEKTGCLRKGFKTISPHHGIERDAVEYRKNGREIHYFAPLMGRIYGLHADEVNGKTVFDNMHDSMKEEFVHDVSRIVKRHMRKK